MTLILQLLFVSRFKRLFTVVLLGHYSQLMEEWSVKPPEAIMPLDMITVQLFNDEVRNMNTMQLFNDEVCDLITQIVIPKQVLSAMFVP